jgi:hypothetical protein
MILTAEDYYVPVAGITPAAWALVTFRKYKGLSLDLPSEVSELLSVQAHVNEGRWSILCPECPGSEYASRIDHRFFCTNCANEAVGGKWIPVVWPSPELTEVIETILNLRGRPELQWWHQGETLTQLIQENEEHGVETRSFLKRDSGRE